MVVDASALVDYLITEESAGRYRAAIEGGAELHVPALCDVEIASAVRELAREGLLSEQEVAPLVRNYLDMPISRHGHELLMQRMIELRHNFTAYDATYVVLAELLDAPLLTADDRLARSVQNAQGVKIRVFTR